MSQALEQLLAATRDALADADEPPRRFDIRVALANSYDALLAGHDLSDSASSDQLLESAHNAGRLLIAAPAASGKTSLVRRLARTAVDRGEPAIRVDLRRWTYSLNERWKAARSSDTARMHLLLSEVATPPIDDEHRLMAAADVGCLVVVDGLNEIPRQVGSQIPWVLDSLAARRPYASVVVCDRFQRRALPSDAWALATITEVRDPLRPGAQSRNALMLDIGEDRASSTSEAQLLLAHVESALQGLVSLERIAAAAYGAYESLSSLYFPLASLGPDVPASATQALLDAGVLIADGDRGSFRHHLFHDALAAYHLVANHDLWNGSAFDVLTFRATSFDAVALALELVSAPVDADELLIELYNWNQYGAAYALSRGRQSGKTAVSEELTLAMLAILAERRWDPVAPTAQRCADALRVFPDALARQLLEASTVDDVRSLISDRVPPTPGPWADTFLRRTNRATLLEQLRSDKLTGWMAANALRESPEDRSLVDELINATKSSHRDVRWRAAHALGAHPSRRTSDRLLALVDHDDDEWVKYGAIRSVVEQAGHADEKLRRRILKQVRRRLGTIRESGLITGELEKALELSEPPFGWAGDVEPLITDLFATSITVSDQDHWRRVGQRITASVRAARKVAT